MDLFNFNEQQLLPFELPSGSEHGFAWEEVGSEFRVEIPHGQLFFAPDYFGQEFSDRALDYLLTNDTVNWRNANWRDHQREALAEVRFKHIQWQHDQIFIYGKRRYQPRYTAWHGDDDAEYGYSGIQLKPQAWNPCLQSIRNRLEHHTGTSFNAVLLNWYRDGRDTMGWHADNEPELGPMPTIASVSFGTERDFHLRSNDKRWKISIPLTHGSLLIMQGQMQRYWQHALPKRLRITDSRVNLTFRRVGGAASPLGSRR